MGGLRLSAWAAAPSPCPSSATARGFPRSPSDWRGLRGRRGRSRCAPSSPPSASPALSLGAAGRLRVGADREWLWDCRGGGLGGGGGGKKDYAKEMEAAVRVVQVACTLCQRVQDSLLLADPGSGSGGVHSKLDRSPVTVAEEDDKTLSSSDGTALLESVVAAVNGCLVEAPKYGLRSPEKDLGPHDVLQAIRKCSSTGGPKGRFWVLDPVDGTLGFVRGDQYAIALALIEDGEVVLGVLGCPNYPMKKEWLNYHQRYYRLMSKVAPPTSGSWNKGCVMYAHKGCGQAWMQPLVHDFGMLSWHNSREVQVSSVSDPVSATFCEPVEKANSSHSFTAGLAHSVGLRNQPLRVYSMVKYAAIARGDAEIFMKFARAGYKEKIWDHAAGVVIIQEAGGVVTDAGGCPLDFSRGVYLEGLDRGIIACSGALLHWRILQAVDASWNSSTL
ncbi:unnamed protein product [Triticum turgidum subsp. durum]|uniref:3'(2'),5'-bisphosphate nucleotidase n=1 Tax=Triticum turgidum subsp. durum TaxID=4567 RepID=A0A9R1BFD6_TRITD|nr:unnamed protein product [Triticum turgidum subsp. durum]